MKLQRHQSLIEDLGVIEVRGGSLIYNSSFYQPWTLSISDIILIGEYTNEDGPHAEDHFVVMFTKVGDAFECPVGASGFVELCHLLGKYLRQPIQLSLQFETGFKSSIIWPPEVRGHALYVIEPDLSTLWRRLLTRMHLGYVRSKLSPRALAVIESR